MNNAKEYGFGDDYDEYEAHGETARTGEGQPESKVKYNEIKGKRQVH